MSLTTALFTGLTGMDAHGKRLDVIGNNISNVNTVGFKGSRALFETQLSRNLGAGTPPDGESGGTNPSQIGLGVQFGGTQRDLSNGSIQPTGVSTDLAIEGNGFFALKEGNEQFFTRNGSFDLNKNNKLVGPNGGVVQGFGVDENFNITRGVTEDVQIPVGQLTIAEATRNVNFSGNLNASGDVATQGTRITSQALNDSTTGGAATSGTNLTDLENASTGASLFTGGETITLQGVEKGGKSLGTFTFRVGGAPNGADASGTTLGELNGFLEDTLGINTNVSNPTGTDAQVRVDPGNGAIEIIGNRGEANHIGLGSADIVSDGSPSQPFTFNTDRPADGESVRTSFTAHDSVGTPLTVDLSMALVDKSSAGTTWRYYATSPDDTDLDRVLDSGTLEFNSFGELANVNDNTIAIDRTDTGAVDPLTVDLNFSGQSTVTALTDTNSELAAVSQDGSGIGTLTSFSIGENGQITGSFDNGLTRTLGQVALTKFANPEGLVDVGSNRFQPGPNSGQPVNTAPESFGTGRVVSGALELSNVDISQEFVDLIATQTGFSANSRVITTSDEMIQRLLATAR